ncbi:GtrA family protein [Leifsonia sp. F6_8S_P_1A]|uniref:GtrA family protein n=1 Tax=Leifsonia virtsii TaxID=3035915 RepID=A0ABT8J009_9MICO|nr:GtrA family protein [Leifsonia virtsii]
MTEDRPAGTPERGRRTGVLALLDHSAVRYLIAGGVAFLVDFGLLWLFHVALGLPTWLAAAISFLLSFFFTYTIQRVFSFGSAAPHGPALIKYTLLVAANTVATAGIVALFDHTALGWAGGKVVATVVTTVWNYFAYRYWVFAHPGRSRAVRKPARED